MRFLPALFVGFCAALATAQEFLPRPTQWSPLMDAPATPFPLGTRLVADPAFPQTEDYIRPRIGATEGGKTTLRLVKAEKHGDFAFGPEGYAILVEPGKDLIIEAATEAGAFYAFATLDALT